MGQFIQAFLPIVVIFFVVVGVLSALASTAAKTAEQAGNSKEPTAYDRMLAEARARAASMREGAAATPQASPPSGQRARLIAPPTAPANPPPAQERSRLQVKRKAEAAPQGQGQRLREHHLTGAVGAARDLSKVDDRKFDSLIKGHHLQSQVSSPDPRASMAQTRPQQGAMTQPIPQPRQSGAPPSSPSQGRTLVDTSADTDPGALIHRQTIDFERIAGKLTPLQRVLILGQILQSRPGEHRASWERF